MSKAGLEAIPASSLGHRGGNFPANKSFNVQRGHDGAVRVEAFRPRFGLTQCSRSMANVSVQKAYARGALLMPQRVKIFLLGQRTLFR